LGDNSEFLLLDLREPEDYELFHIKEAINYPAPNLGRDKIIPELFKFKNKEGKLIIVYHLDERNGIPHANLMAQKGYDNVYLLTGGIEDFLEQHPQYVEGKKVPAPLNKDKKSKVMYKRSRHVGSPDDGHVMIPTKNLEDERKSTISNLTKTSQMTSSTRVNPQQKTQTTMGKSSSKLSSAPKSRSIK